jgi:diguanylate cyclase (GGDEF)-like protein
MVQKTPIEIKQIQHRERQLWMVTVLVIAALTLTIIGVNVLELLDLSGEAARQFRIYLFGLPLLILLYCVYVLRTSTGLQKETGLRSDELLNIKKDLEREISERQRAEEAIKLLAYYDPLTGLPSRVLLKDRLHQAIQAAHNDHKPLALLMMDLERFKEINDTLGHHRGDVLLKQVGTRLKEVLFEPDIVSRLGGDEFAVLLPKLAAMEHIYMVINKIQNSLTSPFVIEELPIAVEVSMGVAIFPVHGMNADTLLQRADVAMYVAKRKASSYAIYSPELDEHSPRRLALMGELRRAIESDQLVLHYQPKLDLKTGRATGVEALVRWQHPQYGFIPPDEFIRLVERTELIKLLTHWVLSSAVRQCRAWHGMGLGTGLSVNLSARDLQDPELTGQVTGLLSDTGMPPRFLSLEITEGTIMSDPARAMSTLTRLNEMGVGLSIDDFGTGYSSLAYLKKLPVDEIKIDKTFVKDMMQDKGDAAIVRSTIDLAHNLDMKVVAEGVEDEKTRDQLTAMGCDAAQGYYWSRPLTATEATQWLNRSA